MGVLLGPVAILARVPIAEDPEPRPADEPANDPFADLVLDEEFVKGATVKEASGRARMLSARWKRKPPPEPEAWRPVTEIRRSRFGRKARKLDPWGRPVRRRKLNWQAPLFIVLAVAVTLAGLNVDRLRNWYQGSSQDTASAHVTQAPETAAPTAAPPTTAPKDPTVDHPWAGSPAETWPAGSDAIQLPEAKAIGAFDRDEVAAQLKLVKDYLVTSSLDPTVISGGDPSAALDLLGGKQRSVVEENLQHPSHDHSATSWFTRFDPRTAILVGTTVKVQGHMSFEDDGDNGVMVHADYTFVYALRPGPDAYKAQSPSGSANPVSWTAIPMDSPKGDTAVTRTIVRRAIDFRFYDPAKYQVKTGKIYWLNEKGDGGNTGCDQSDGFFHPYFPFGAHDGPTPSPGATTVDPYDRSKPLPDQDSGCHHSSRS